MNKSIFCISIDTELLWGRKDLDYSKFIEKTKKERKIIKKLLLLFQKYEIPVTWAIVGKLYEKGDKLWSGQDIINWIKKEKIHELGSHTYSHEIMSKISLEKADIEIRKSKAASFVFPRNKIKYLHLLRKYGFKSYRAKDKSEYELLIPRFPPTGKAVKLNNLVAIPSSMYFVSSRGFRKFIPSSLRLFKSILGINKAIKNNEIFHIWFHPADFTENSNALFSELEEVLKYANKKRSEGKLEIKTMQQIAKDFKK